MAHDYQTIAVAIVEGGIATVTLNRPKQRNALNTRMCEELLAAMTALGADESVRVVLVRANGPAFCAGADLKERKDMSSDEVRTRRLRGFAAYDAIENLPQPAIAVVHGATIGSGCEIATACDLLIASSEASFRYPEVGWGTVGATQRLPRIVGKRLAKELLYTGRMVGAEEAKQIGLANRIVAPSELDIAAMELAQKIGAAPPLAMRLTKRSLDQGMDSTRAGALADRARRNRGKPRAQRLEEEHRGLREGG